jgi:hypothetical protein
MPVDFYYSLHSPPCRSVLLLAKAVGVDLNLLKLSLMDNEHKAETFIKVSTSVLDGNKYSPSRSGLFTSEERAPYTHWIGS